MIPELAPLPQTSTLCQQDYLELQQIEYASALELSSRGGAQGLKAEKKKYRMQAQSRYMFLDRIINLSIMSGVGTKRDRDKGRKWEPGLQKEKRKE
ncbi:hypothetical protein TNCV_6181 [Trichonephila clavipes]|nr:hypothetical protein TNCV_6181 [Trichonephila clavipes]